jgi:hypothetical protein
VRGERQRVRRVSAQLRSASHRFSKILRDHDFVEARIDPSESSTLVFSVNREGEYSLRLVCKAEKGPAQEYFFLMGKVHDDGTMTLYPKDAPAIEYKPPGHDPALDREQRQDPA